MAIFAKFEGIDGESVDANHDKWVDVIDVNWGMNRPAAGQGRRRGSATVEDLTLVFEYEKAAPKLEESCLVGLVIKKLEIELTANFGGARTTYLRYALKNVRITGVQVSASGNDEDGPPIVVITNSFERIRVTYTEFDDNGSSQGDVEYAWRAEKSQ